MITFLRAHKRVITFSLVALGAYWLAPSWEEGVAFHVFLLFFAFLFALFVMLIASQLFWIRRAPLEFAHRGLALGGWDFRYFSGWYEKTGSQIYVNRGIGTIGFPIRLGARPEITVFELVRAV